MTWNYRIFKHVYNDMSNDQSEYYSIREVYYDEHDNIKQWSTEAAFPCGETFEELREDFKLLEEAFHKSVLNEQEIVINNNEEGEIDE